MSNWGIGTVVVAVLGLLFGYVATVPGHAQDVVKSWVDVIPEQNETIVILRDTKGADEVIVTTFFKQKLKGIDEPIVRSVTDVVGAVKDVAVGAKGAPDPKDVTEVHVSLATITQRMSWKPPAIQ